MKRNFDLPVLVVTLALAWPLSAHAQQSDASVAEGKGAADLGQLQTMAEQGDPDAQFRLGELYEEGEILERDLGKAIASYREAAEQGHAGAQYALAHVYHLGSGVPQDMATAMVWYRKAALQGDEWSQLALGDQYRIGLAVPRDLVQSTAWYRMAADQGNIFAQYELGNAYRYGNGVDKDLSQAIAWYRASAAAGNPSANLALTELGAGAAAGGTAPQTPPAAGPAGLATSAAGDVAVSDGAAKAGEAGQAATASPRPESARPGASAAPPTDGPDLDTELAFATAPAISDEETVSQLLKLATDQVANLALTTPAGDNAYETYQRVLFLQPGNQAALDGFERIGVKYAELAELAAAKGDLRQANLYAAKAKVLAPEHPLVEAIAIAKTMSPPTEQATLTSESLAEIKAPQRAPAQDMAAAEVEIATATSAAAKPDGLVERGDDLVLAPDNYLGRQVMVTGSVVRFLGKYRLKSEFGQNSIVIDVGGLSQADGAKLDAAIEKAGLFGQVRARIKGRIERQSLATFELAATDLALTAMTSGDDEALGQAPDPDFVEVVPLVVPVYPGELFGRTNADNNRSGSGDRGVASASSGNSGSGDSGGSSAGGGGSSGGSGGSAAGGGASDGGGSGDSAGPGAGGGKGNGKGNGKGGGKK